MSGSAMNGANGQSGQTHHVLVERAKAADTVSNTITIETELLCSLLRLVTNLASPIDWSDQDILETNLRLVEQLRATLEKNQ